MIDSCPQWLCILSVILSLAANACAQSTTTDAGWLEAVRAELREFPDRLERDAKATFFNGDNAAALLWAGLASAAMNNGADDRVAGHFDDHGTFSGGSAEAFNIIGSPLTHFSAGALWYVVSANGGDDVNKDKALTMIAALSINGAVTVALKAARQNDRPAGDGWAWPSGHTSSSFTVASVLHEFYGLKVGLPAYAVAGLVAYRMMDVGDHWASDVVFGATLGWVVGHTVARNHKGPRIAGFEVLPFYGSGEHRVVGVNLARRF